MPMANTYTQIHIHAVFSVQNRKCLISNVWRDDLYKYIEGIIRNNHHKPIIINGMPDHVHVLFGMRPVQSLSGLLQDIKCCSSKWINDNNLAGTRFSWQEGYGAFSYGKSQLPRIIKYIDRQDIHHRRKTFIEEYQELLEAFDIGYDNRYIFKPV